MLAVMFTRFDPLRTFAIRRASPFGDMSRFVLWEAYYSAKN
jgi:hypothetical protein